MELNKQITKPAAVTVLAITAAISISISAIYLHSLRKQYASMEQDSPESAITEYFSKINQKSYDELYQEAARSIRSRMTSSIRKPKKFRRIPIPRKRMFRSFRAFMTGSIRMQLIILWNLQMIPLIPML